MVESSKTSLPALVDYIAFAQDRELMNLIGNGKNLHSRAVPRVISLPEVTPRPASPAAPFSRRIFSSSYLTSVMDSIISLVLFL